ncbi:MAG: Ig-like domain-containing protein, partial [Candidatus Dormibacteria bacterium]
MLLAPLALTAATGGLSACGPLSPPQITNVAPAPSQGAVHTSDLLVVTFNMPMNKLSVERRMFMRTRKDHKPPDCSLARATSHRRTGCHFRWRDGGRVLELTHPHHPWAVITTYRVEIQGGIRAASGAANSLSHSWEFSTEGGPQVSSTFPGDGGILGPDQPIAINFSRDMQPAAVERSTVLSPEPPGGYSWESSRAAPGRFLLEPNRPLSPGVTYTLAVARPALDVDGNRLQRAALVHFSVGKLGSTTSVVFPAGPSSSDYTEVLAATPLALAGDPASLRVLATAPAGQHYQYAWPSPDGLRLASELAGNQPVQVLDLATGKSVTVLGSTGATAAAWSPDGTQLAFVVAGALRIYSVADTTTVTLSSALGMSGPLSWRPDGQVVSAVATPAGDPTRIALLSPALKAITFLPGSDPSPLD